MEESPGVYVARVAKPAEGFTAFFVELVYDSGFRNPWKFTSEVSVVPDILPSNGKTRRRNIRGPGGLDSIELRDGAHAATAAPSPQSSGR